MRHLGVIVSLLAVGTLAGCTLAPSTAGSPPASARAVPTTAPRTPPSAPGPVPGPPGSRPEAAAFSGATTLGQRDANGSEDDPASFHYRVRYSLDQLVTAETGDPSGRPGLVGTRVTAAAAVFVTNMTPHHTAPLNDLSGVMIGGAYKLDRGICHQRHTPLAQRGDYCFVSLWTSPDSPGELAMDQTRQLGGSSPTSWDITPLPKKENDALARDLLTPDVYFIASLGHGYNFVPKIDCTISFDLTSGHAVIDTKPHVNVCLDA